MRSKYQSYLLIAVAVYVLQLGVDDRLGLYIHPRYIIFTMALSLIGLLLLIANASSKNKSHEYNSFNLLSHIPLFVVLAAALLFAPKSLTSSTVSQRTIDSGSIVTSQSSRPLSTLFSGSSKGLQLQDWSRLIAANEDPDFYANKPASISGFAYDAGLGNDTVWLARFVLTCCAVDAQPIGIPVRIEGWQDSYSQDEWLSVDGEFELADTEEGAQIVLVPTTVNRIDEPRNPYAN